MKTIQLFVNFQCQGKMRADNSCSPCIYQFLTMFHIDFAEQLLVGKRNLMFKQAFLKSFIKSGRPSAAFFYQTRQIGVFILQQFFCQQIAKTCIVDFPGILAADSVDDPYLYALLFHFFF